MIRWGFAAALVALLGCHPKVKQWTVRPHAYCPTTSSIHVAWKTKHGDTRIEITEPGRPPDVRRVGSKGTLELPPKPMDIALFVKKGAVELTAPVTIGPNWQISELAGYGNPCTNGWMKTDPFQYGGNNQSLDPNLELGTISNACAADAPPTHTCRRNVKIRHGVHVWELAPGQVRDVSGDRAKLGGETWILEQQLIGAEQCETPSATPALDFQLGIATVCKEGP
jgi:hypothetical protein